MTSTADVGSAVSRNARHIMGSATGIWASSSWAFYSDIRGNEFTVVAKNMMPKSVDAAGALKAAKALASEWGLSNAVFWTYPQKNKRDQHMPPEYTTFSILSDFTPTVELANYLFEAFHNPNNTVLSKESADRPLSKRDECVDTNPSYLVRFNIFPWNTNADAGCFGNRNDFL